MLDHPTLFGLGDRVRVTRFGKIQGLLGKVMAIRMTREGVFYGVTFHGSVYPLWFEEVELTASSPEERKRAQNGAP